jgi:hypothetical protein
VYVVRGEDSGELTAGIENDFLARVGNRFAAGNNAPDPANVPPAGYLWNAASQAGLKVRNYGFMVHNLTTANADGEQIDRVYDPALTASTDMEYRGPDAAFPDIERAKEFATEMGEYGQLGEMPQLLLVRIGKDDAAVSTMVEALTKSRFWNETAMFVAESGGGTRVYSPLSSQPASVGSDPFSVLRTVEAILGLRPLTIFDAAARPLTITLTPAQ